MQALFSRAGRGDDHLWLIAVGLSLLLNVSILAGMGFVGLAATRLEKLLPVHPQAPESSVAMIFPEIAKTAADGSPGESVPVVAKRFVRTSADQAAPPDDKNTLFIGERDTLATSDQAALSKAPPLPSQKGINTEDDTELETTESTYQDGHLGGASASPTEVMTPPVPNMLETPAPLDLAMARTDAAREKPEIPGKDAERSLPSAREKPMEGPNPVDVQVPRETQKDDKIKSAREQRPAADSPPPQEPALTSKPAEMPQPKTKDGPSFKGFQRKTAIVGSISRDGHSALDVADSELGRYQAVISRAVEQEWQRNCVRHRDFITPGFLTVRFFIESRGKVRSVQFVGDMETGEVQKGFTLNSIRDAEIPAMPAALAREYAKDPLELVFRFYF